MHKSSICSTSRGISIGSPNRKTHGLKRTTRISFSTHREEELVLTHIRKPERFEKVHYLTVTEIAELIRERTGYQYSHGTKAQLGKVMSKHGFEFHKGKNGRRYTVFIIDTEQVKSNRLYE